MKSRFLHQECAFQDGSPHQGRHLRLDIHCSMVFPEGLVFIQVGLLKGVPLYKFI